jgi:hypothetical protein
VSCGLRGSWVGRIDLVGVGDEWLGCWL